MKHLILTELFVYFIKFYMDIIDFFAIYSIGYDPSFWKTAIQILFYIAAMLKITLSFILASKNLPAK